MPDRSSDPYQTLGVRANVSDAELRAAYRRLVQLHHPDHNGGSAESARRFEAVQDAYAQIRAMRSSTGTRARARGEAGQTRPAPAAPFGSTAGGRGDPNVESRLADLERELHAAREARERARRAAREAARATTSDSAQGESPRPSREELGYIDTDDSFTKILADAASDISGRLSEARDEAPKHVPRRISELIDELAAKLTGDPPKS